MAAKPFHSAGQPMQPPPKKADRFIRGANDNAAAGEACVTDVGAALPAQDLTDEELAILQPLISALARLAAKRLSATTISWGEI